MKKIITKAACLMAILSFAANYSHAQLNGFVLTPSGNTENYMKYIRKAVNVNGTSYYTAYLTLSSFRNVTTNTYYNDITPFQKLQIQGGNILLCQSNSPGSITDINPTSKNGAILFSDWASDNDTYKHGKWGIEYDNQYSTGGLNFFNPVSQLFGERQNFKLFLSNSGNVGIGSNDPVAKLQVKDGDIFIEDINGGIIMKSPDGNCWRGVLNNQGQLEFRLLTDCITTSVSEIKNQSKPLFNISPNPASGYVQISCSPVEVESFHDYFLYNSSGVQIKTGKFDKTYFTINLQGLPTGAYIINFIGPNRFWSEKLIIR